MLTPGKRAVRRRPRSLDADALAPYRAFMSGRERVAERLLVLGAGPTLSYELVRPATDPSSASAVTLLCLHGNSSHRGVWRLVARELVEFRCVLLDFRGHGDSEHVSPAAYNPEHHAADLAQIVASLVKSPYAILGHSAGALAAARFITNARATVPVAMPVAFVWVDP